MFLEKLVLELIKLKKKSIYIVGDHFNNNKVNNIGNLARDKLQNFLARTKFSINSAENFYSLFAIDCISNNVDLFFDKKNFYKKNLFPKENIHLINFNNFNKSFSIIKNTIKKTRNGNVKKLAKQKKKIEDLISCYI